MLPFHLSRSFFVRCIYLQDYSKEAVTNVQKYLMKNEVPVNLFEVSHWVEGNDVTVGSLMFYALRINLDWIGLVTTNHTGTLITNID